MEKIKTDYYKLGGADDDGIFERCGEIIRGGGLVAFPTETVYGLGVSAFEGDCVKKVFAAKGRPSDNPLIVHIAYPADAEKIAVTSDLYYDLAERFMPGPLTVILPRRDNIPNEVTGGLDSVGIRCPAHPAAHRLILAARVPIAAPSANLSGAPSPTLGEHVMRDMDGKIEAVIDGGACDFGLESTVITVNGRDAEILRPGAVTREDLLEVCDSVSVSAAVKDPLLAGERPVSPGMKYKHYAPKAKFSLVNAEGRAFADYVNSLDMRNVGVICSFEDAPFFRKAKSYVYGHNGDVRELCHNLFGFFRQADDDGIEYLFAELPRDSGQSLALYNRMIRASGSVIIDPEH